jgi:hypothetical protein
VDVEPMWTLSQRNSDPKRDNDPSFGDLEP